MVTLIKHGLRYLLRTRFAVCVFAHHTVSTQCDSVANWYFDIQIKKQTKCSVLGRRPKLSLVCHMFRSSWAVIKAFATVKREVHEVNGSLTSKTVRPVKMKKYFDLFINVSVISYLKY